MNYKLLMESWRKFLNEQPYDDDRGMSPPSGANQVVDLGDRDPTSGDPEREKLRTKMQKDKEMMSYLHTLGPGSEQMKRKIKIFKENMSSFKTHKPFMFVHRMFHQHACSGGKEKLSALCSVRSQFSAGVIVRIQLEGNDDPEIDGQVIKFMHMKEYYSGPFRRGQVAAVCGRSGLVGPKYQSAPHLHLEFIKNGKQVDAIPEIANHYKRKNITDTPQWQGWINRYRRNSFGVDRYGDGRPHGGVDIFMPVGTEITCPFNGRVISGQPAGRYRSRVKSFLKSLEYYNNMIKKDDYLLEYTFNNISWKVLFKKGQTIDLIGDGDIDDLDMKIGGKYISRMPAVRSIDPEWQLFENPLDDEDLF